MMPTNALPQTPRTAWTAACLGLLLLFAAAPLAAAERTVSETYELTPNGRISLQNLNGNVSIEGWDRDEVSLEAQIEASSRDSVDALKIEVDADPDRLRIETDSPNRRGGWGRDWARVNFTLKVPRGAELSEISLVNGSLDLRELSGDIEASLVNGNLDARELSGSLELSSVNGSIDLELERLGSGQRLDVESVNGSIDLILPGDADAEIEASTVHGRISNDFGLRVDKGEYVGSDLSGRLGNGSARVSLENVNGSIDIKR
ncbi:MAG: DUF4097 family beta strand repeat-containing protein [Acidobacteriota bacterium]